MSNLFAGDPVHYDYAPGILDVTRKFLSVIEELQSELVRVRASVEDLSRKEREIAEENALQRLTINNLQRQEQDHIAEIQRLNAECARLQTYEVWNDIGIDPEQEARATYDHDDRTRAGGFSAGHGNHPRGPLHRVSQRVEDGDDDLLRDREPDGGSGIEGCDHGHGLQPEGDGGNGRG